MRRSKQDRWRRQRGQSLLETALMIVIIFTVMMWVFEIGQLMYTYTVLADAANEGVRYAIVHPTNIVSGTTARVTSFATDYGQVWAHRQIAQAAADAACEAGAADLFLVGTDPTAAADFPGLSFSWIGSAGSTFNCSSNASSPPCQYANLNGYSGA